jgi:hypothetical protein
MVNSEAIAEIDRLVEQHLSVARALQVARAHLAGDNPATIVALAAPDGAPAPAVATSNSLTVQVSEREARIKSLNGIEFFNLKYNDAVAAALQVWGPELPRPKRADIIKILTKGGFAHPKGEAGARISIRNASASGVQHNGPVIKLPDGDPEGEYALREWFGNRVAVRPVRRHQTLQKEMTADPMPEEQQTGQTTA